MVSVPRKATTRAEQGSTLDEIMKRSLISALSRAARPRARARRAYHRRTMVEGTFAAKPGLRGEHSGGPRGSLEIQSRLIVASWASRDPSPLGPPQRGPHL